MSGRLSRLQAEANANTMAGNEQVLVEDWCQQYPSHSIGDLGFGTDGALYANGGEWVPPTPEGGALCSQDLRTGSDPAGMNGAVLSLDPETGGAMPGNPLIGSADPNARRIVAYGLRNPFRFAIRLGTNEVWIGWIGNVGASSQDEIKAIRNSKDQPVENFGWPCYNGTRQLTSFDSADLTICENLYAEPGATTGPVYVHNRHQPAVEGETGLNDQNTLSGLAFCRGGDYPSSYDGALLFADYGRNCIWTMRKGADGAPDPTNRATFVEGAETSVDMEIGPDGDLFYVNIGGG